MFIFIGNCQQLANLSHVRVSFRIIKIIISFFFLSRFPFSVSKSFIDWFQEAAARMNQLIPKKKPSYKNLQVKSVMLIKRQIISVNRVPTTFIFNVHNFISFSFYSMRCFFRPCQSHIAIIHIEEISVRTMKWNKKRNKNKKRHWMKPINQVWQKGKVTLSDMLRINALLNDNEIFIECGNDNAGSTLAYWHLFQIVGTGLRWNNNNYNSNSITEVGQ